MSDTLRPSRDGLHPFAIDDVAGMLPALGENGFAIAAAAITPAPIERARVKTADLRPLND